MQYLSPSEIDEIVYRSPPSTDSVYAAMVAYNYGKTTSKCDMIYTPTFGDYLPEDVQNKKLLIIGMQYKPAIMLNLIKKAKKLLILVFRHQDHSDIPNTNKIVYNYETAVMAAWNYFHPNTEIPAFITHCEQKASNKKLNDEDDLNAYLLTLNKHHYTNNQNAIIDNLAEHEQLLDYGTYRGSIEKGKIFRQQNLMYIEQACGSTWWRFMKLGAEYYLVDHVNCSIPMLMPEIALHMIKKHPNANFSAVYNTRSEGITNFSLRSTDKHSDIQHIAEMFHGGGKRYTAGFTVNHTTCYIPGKLIGIADWSQYLHTLKFYNWGDDITIVSFCHSNDKLEIGTYLLQDRTRGEQNAIAIGHNEKIKSVPSKVDISIIWNYDPLNNHSYFKIIRSKQLSESKWTGMIFKYWKLILDDSVYQLKGSVDGILDPSDPTKLRLSK